MSIAHWVRRVSSKVRGQAFPGDRLTMRQLTGRTHLQLELLEDRRLLAVIGNNLAVGSELRHFRLAIAATAEYTAFHGGQASAFAEIQSVVDDLNQIFVSELAIRLDLVSGTNTVFTDPATDGYSNGQVNTMLGENTSILNDVLGSTAYDIGHVFGTLIGAGGAGVAGLGVVGSSAKAQGASISSNPVGNSWTMLVAHEIGHQFGAEHTFNSTLGSCYGERSSGNAYEPASGTTLMSYAGICGADNLALDVIPIFHSASFEEIQTLISSPPALPHGVTTISNSIPTIDGGPDFVIPAGTPFELVAMGSDADAEDVLTYSWEQLDLGPAQGLPLSDHGSGPLLRVLEPAVASNRVFPNLNDLLQNINTASAGEVLPTTTREMNFRVTVRDGRGGVNSDDVLISVIHTGSNFAVTSPNTAVNWSGGSSELVQWNVAGTSGGAINATEIDILLSTDGGFTYPFLLSTTNNDGSHTIDVPNIDTSLARIRLQASGSIFFDVSDQNFTITANPALPGLTMIESNGSTRPVEGGADDSYTIALNSDPGGDVTVQVTTDAQTLISIDGSPFADSVTAVFDSVDPKTVRVRAIDDEVFEGPHSSVIAHSVISSSSVDYPVGMLLNNVIAAVYDNETPPLVGVDFNSNAAGSTPLNWTSYLIPTNFSANTLTNLGRDDGVSTPYDLTFQYDIAGFSSFSSSQSAEASTKPRHLPSLQAIDGFNGANNGITITWSDLAAGHDYGVYVFGLDGPGDDAGQDVTISGSGTPITFTQALDDRKLYVNDSMGDSSQPLINYELVVPADANGQIVIRVVPKAGSTEFSLAGLAIRQVPMPASAPEINVSGNGINIVSGDASPDVADGTDFGIVEVNAGAATSTYTIDNFTGTAALNVSSVTIVGSSDFSTAPFLPASIPVGQSLSFDVIFAPTAIGTATAIIEIVSDDETDSWYDFVVTGAGAMVAVPPAVQSVVINGGDNQRSSLTSVVVTFDSLVDVPEEAFRITKIGIPFDSTSTPVTGLLVDTTNVGSQTVTTITFGSGDSIVDRATANTLADGNYRLDITASQVTASQVTAPGDSATMSNDFQFGATAADNFFRLFGDADGNGNVDFLDFSYGFLPAFGVSNTSPEYRDEMDADGDHDVDFLDFSAGFLPNFGKARF